MVRFHGRNAIELTLPFRQDNFLGSIGTTLEINRNKDGKYYLFVVSDSLDTTEKQVSYLEMVAEYLSFLINRNEHSPHYGTNFVKIGWFGFNAIPIQDCTEQFHDALHISAALAMTSTRTVALDTGHEECATYHDLLRFYFDGLRAEHKKSKYFHWFLILEYLENSQIYKTQFSSNTLFDKHETAELSRVADKMSNEVKKSAVLKLLSRTKEPRNYKLLRILNEIGINSIRTDYGTKELEI